MATHLGRNPFQSKSEKSKRAQDSSKKAKDKEVGNKSESSKPTESIFVKVHAASAVLALKTLFFVKGLVQKK